MNGAHRPSTTIRSAEDTHGISCASATRYRNTWHLAQILRSLHTHALLHSAPWTSLQIWSSRAAGSPIQMNPPQ